MQSLSQIGNARREERVLLPALIELRSELGEEALTADVIDVSQSGLSVRAAFVPEVGTQLMLSFRCPPRDDAVHALGEVVWSAWDGPRIGSFGLRFLELDTKSATAIRRYVAPERESVETPALPRVATMRIDGLGAPIEADVRLYDQACIVLEQELSFLRLGRGIEVDMPGRGKERGRIASIELRQGPLDTPTLVFGVLLDPQAPAAMGELAARSGLRELEAPSGSLADEARARAEPELAAKRRVDEPRVVRVRPSEHATPNAEPDEDLEVERALQNRIPAGLVVVGNLLAASYAWLRGTLLPWLLTGGQRLRAWLSAGDSKPWSGQLLMSLARIRAALAGQIERSWKRLQRRRTTAPAPRVQRSAAVTRPQRSESVATTPPRSRRWLTVGFAALGVGLGVYALAPRSGADRIRIPKAEKAQVSLAAVQPSAQPTVLPPAPVVSQVQLVAAPGAEALASAEAVHALEPTGPSPRFGEPNVPNGRVFVLRMSGPVRVLEGESREDGFSVRIPGRLALDRASPIATSHRAVARALILNRGEYAELTIEFLPGMRPKYQVAAKDSSIEVTLERL